MESWQSYWEQGGSYYRTACGGYKRPEKFNPDALFNLAAMSIEKMSMAMLLKDSVMPEGHTFLDLAESLDRVAPLPDDLKNSLIRLDDFQAGFCSLVPESSPSIDLDDIPPMLRVCDRLRSYVRDYVGG